MSMMVWSAHTFGFFLPICINFLLHIGINSIILPKYHAQYNSMSMSYYCTNANLSVQAHPYKYEIRIALENYISDYERPDLRSEDH